MKRTCLFLAAAGLAMPVAAAAQKPSQVSTDRETIDEVIVSAARTQQPASAIAGTVTIVDRETIRQQVAISDDLASVLSRTIPGFAPSSQKLAGRGETLRGRNPLYLVDGVPQHNALRDGQRDGHTIDTAFIERIEVINGSNAIQGDIMDSTSLSLFGKAEWRLGNAGALTLMVNDFDLERNGDFRSVAGDRDAGVPTGTIETVRIRKARTSKSAPSSRIPNRWCFPGVSLGKLEVTGPGRRRGFPPCVD